MKILITGATGLIGKALITQLTQLDSNKHHLILLTRNQQKAEKALSPIVSDRVTFIDDLSRYSNFDDIDTIINLAGEPIAAKRWSTEQKQRIINSRCQLTEQLVKLCVNSSTPPRCFISGSAVGYYGHQEEKIIDESLIVHSDAFTNQVCRQWEEMALKAHNDTTRVCLLRTGVVLSDQGGALPQMRLPYLFGLGGPIGNGKQYLAWIHIKDMVNGILYLLDNDSAQGIYNFTSPNSISNRTFSQCLAKTLKRPHFLFVPKWVLQTLLGEASVLVTDSQNVKPTRLLETGFQFQYPDIESALMSFSR